MGKIVSTGVNLSETEDGKALSVAQMRKILDEIVEHLPEYPEEEIYLHYVSKHGHHTYEGITRYSLPCMVFGEASVLFSGESLGY